MHPVLFTVAGVPVPTHGFFVALGFAVGLGVFLAEARRRAAWDDRLLPVLAGIVGGRFASVIDSAASNGLDGLLWAWLYGGRSILGGLTGAYLGALAGKRLGGYEGRTGNLFAPAVALALAVGRVGCFLTEAPGRPTDLPWGVTVTPDQAAVIPQCPGCVAGVAMHPSFLYEIAFLLVAFVALRWVRDRITAPGELFPLFLAAYALFRFGVELTRANPVLVLGLTGSQVFIALASPLFVTHLVREARRGTYAGLRPSPSSIVRGTA
jgi:phosphatidylglycerol:prolipoprotein diacylglycerol transferase